MTHYEQCCARECPGCAKELPFSAAEGHHWTGNLDAPRCTAPTLAEFAERCAEALRPFASFADAFDAKPINGLDPEEIYSIHGGDQVNAYGATLRWSDMRAARRALGLEKG